MLLNGTSSGAVMLTLVALLLRHASGMSAQQCKRLPSSRLIIGYATSRSLREDKVVPACMDGVNVVIWSFAHLERDSNGKRASVRRAT